jgi:hypothetical protein
MKYIVISLLVVFLFGCASPVKYGGADTYISNKMLEYAKYSSRPVKRASLGKFDKVQWKCSEDKSGFVVTVFGDNFDLINGFFQSMLGTPSLVATNYMGKPKIMYLRPDFNFSVEYSVRNEERSSAFPESVSIVVLKPKELLVQP